MNVNWKTKGPYTWLDLGDYYARIERTTETPPRYYWAVSAKTEGFLASRYESTLSPAMEACEMVIDFDTTLRAIPVTDDPNQKQLGAG